MSMTVEEYVAREIFRLINFQSEWARQVRERPDEFPVEMDLGDWDESFDTFQDVGETEEA